MNTLKINKGVIKIFKNLFSADEIKVSGLLIGFFIILAYIVYHGIVCNSDIPPNFLTLIITIVGAITGLNISMDVKEMKTNQSKNE